MPSVVSISPNRGTWDIKNEERCDGWMGRELQERNTGSQGSDINLCAIDLLRNAKLGAGSAFSTLSHSHMFCALDLQSGSLVSFHATSCLV